MRYPQLSVLCGQVEQEAGQGSDAAWMYYARVDMPSYDRTSIGWNLGMPM